MFRLFTKFKHASATCGDRLMDRLKTLIFTKSPPKERLKICMDGTTTIFL
jgi:hypothetical protein